MNRPSPLCSVCRRRPSVYKRTYSGEYLCPSCLRRALEKAVRRSLGGHGLLKPGMRLLVPATLSSPLWSMVLVEVLSRVEKRYGSKVIFAVPNSLEGLELNKIEHSNVEPVGVRVIPENPPEAPDPIACWRYDRRWALRVARSLEANAVIMPLTRTDLNLIMIEALLRGEPEALSEARPVLHWTEPPVISGLWRAEGELVAAYAAVNGLEAPSGCTPRLVDAKDLFYSIARGRPELEYSTSKTMSLLSKAETIRACRECGGLGGPLCRYCRGYSISVEIGRLAPGTLSSEGQALE